MHKHLKQIAGATLIGLTIICAYSIDALFYLPSTTETQESTTMTTITTFKDWQEKRLEYLLDTNAMVPCPTCRGSGELECDCCGHERECEDCDENGKVNIHQASHYKPSAADYFHSVITDLKDLCAWTNKDPLAEIGHFVRDFRSGHMA